MPVEVNARTIEYKGHKLILSVVRDIHERKLAEDLIMSTLKEKDLLLKEMKRQTKFDHEVFSRILERLSGAIDGDSLLEDTQNAQNRIKSMAYIKERIYSFPSISKIDFAELTTRLIRFVSSLYPIGIKNLRVKNEIHDIYLDLVNAIPLALIINEFLSNSLKHAFNDSNKSRISINVSKENKGKHVLLYYDDGIGCPETINLRNPDTIGMQLVNNLVNQLNGSIRLNTNKGTEFIVEF
jgi:two-component sensor histidine kinase